MLEIAVQRIRVESPCKTSCRQSGASQQKRSASSGGRQRKPGREPGPLQKSSFRASPV